MNAYECKACGRLNYTASNKPLPCHTCGEPLEVSDDKNVLVERIITNESKG